MSLRGQRTDLRICRDVVRDSRVPEESTTWLSPWAVAGDDAVDAVLAGAHPRLTPRYGV